MLALPAVIAQRLRVRSSKPAEAGHVHDAGAQLDVLRRP
jgi:hypothetical protein